MGEHDGGEGWTGCLRNFGTRLLSANALVPRGARRSGDWVTIRKL